MSEIRKVETVSAEDVLFEFDLIIADLPTSKLVDRDAVTNVLLDIRNLIKRSYT